MTMAELASILTPNIGEPVVDGTGLKGIYQFTIALPRDEAYRQAMRASLPWFAQNSTSADWEPETDRTLKAVEELGLELQRRRVPVDVLVIDSIQRRPTEN